MNAKWVFPVAVAYSGNVPRTVDSEILRLRFLFGERCRGPYDENGVKFGLAVFVQGINEIKPMKRRGIRVEPFRNNLLIADIYVHRVDWDVSPAAFRGFLWRNAEQAAWECIERLKKSGISIAEERFRHDLSLVRREFLGDNESSGVEDSHTKNTPTRANTSTRADSFQDEEHQVVIQYRIGHGAGTADDINKRHAVEHVLGTLLEAADLGYCDGGDIGCGTMNIFCNVKSRGDAAQAIVETLRKSNLLNGAVIAETVDDDEMVIWPPDFEGEFQLIHR